MEQNRWVRPLATKPGHWKKQLSTKYLKLAQQKDATKLREYLKAHPTTLNQQGPHGRTFLFEATRKDRFEAVKWLLQHGADPSLPGCYNSESMVQICCLAASLFYRRPQIEAFYRKLNLRLDVWRACFCNEFSTVQAILKAQPELVYEEDPTDEIYFHTPLSFAIAGGHLDLAKFLTQSGAKIIPYGVQLLFISSHRNDIEIVKWLLTQGVRAECADASLWMSTNDLSILQLLTEYGLSANTKRYSNLTPLMYVCRADKGQNTRKVALILNLGGEIDAIGPGDRTALHYAVAGGYAETVKLLLTAGANRHLKDAKGQTAEALASAKKDYAILDAFSTIA